jgi:hypothetical protein
LADKAWAVDMVDGFNVGSAVVILSEAKDLAARTRFQILRFTQNDMWLRAFFGGAGIGAPQQDGEDRQQHQGC